MRAKIAKVLRPRPNIKARTSPTCIDCVEIRLWVMVANKRLVFGDWRVLGISVSKNEDICIAITDRKDKEACILATVQEVGNKRTVEMWY